LTVLASAFDELAELGAGDGDGDESTEHDRDCGVLGISRSSILMVWKVMSEGVWGSADGSGVVEKSVDANDSLKEASMICVIDCKKVKKDQASGWRVVWS
jgi:hypothetical protein